MNVERFSLGRMRAAGRLPEVWKPFEAVGLEL